MGAGLRRVSVALASLLTVGIVTGCTEEAPVPPTTTAAPTVARPFTVATTQPVQQLDPAYVTSDTGTLVATSVFQRLMVLDPSTGELKPDVASDCLFRQSTVYECTLRKGVLFHNGNALTSSDVKFSITRAIALGQGAGNAVLFSSLSTIETPDDHTVRFRLSWADTQFASALATPAGSIVDEASYSATALRSEESIPVGSGPYRLGIHNDDGALFTEYIGYKGPTKAKINTIQVTTMSDSSAVEQAMDDDQIDVAWKGLDAPAVTRLQQQIDSDSDQVTQSGWSRVPRTGLSVQRLTWNPKSSYRLNAALRNRVSLSLQPERTLDSIVPRGVDGYVASFALGGVPTLPPMDTSKVTLRLGYDSGQPGSALLASVIQNRLKSTAQVAVELVADDSSADLYLSDALPPLSSAAGWLLSFMTNPLPGSAAKLKQIDQTSRSTTDDNTRLAQWSEAQKQAAADNVVIPLTQSDGALFLASNVKVSDSGFAPGWQLALWGLEKQ